MQNSPKRDAAAELLLHYFKLADREGRLTGDCLNEIRSIVELIVEAAKEEIATTVPRI